MFQEWGFLISEMLLLIILAALLGLLVGWIIWGRRGGEVSVDAGLQADLDRCRADAATVQADLKTARADLDACRTASASKDARIAALEGDIERLSVATTPAAVAAPVTAPVAAPEPVETATADYDGDGVLEGENEGVKPATLTAARDGKADDLKQIKGIGPKLEKLCNELGFYHFDQVAAWTADEVVWVDANLQGFKGRVSRDNWVDQAKVLAAGGTTDFANKVKKGDVYD